MPKTETKKHFTGGEIFDLRTTVRRCSALAAVRMLVRSRRRPQVLRLDTPSTERCQRRRRGRPQGPSDKPGIGPEPDEGHKPVFPGGDGWGKFCTRPKNVVGQRRVYSGCHGQIWYVYFLLLV